MHYQRFLRHGGTNSKRMRGATEAERLAAYVKRGDPDECWPWRNGIKTTYPMLRGDDGKPKPASRAAWEAEHGAIPDGMEVCHSCDNPPCCNPRHLFLGSHDENMKDMASKGRAVRTHCPQGHPYDETNTYVNPTTGGRHCRTCRTIWNARRRSNGNVAPAKECALDGCDVSFQAKGHQLYCSPEHVLLGRRATQRKRSVIGAGKRTAM